VPVTVAELEEAVAWRCGQLLRDVGRYLDGAAGTTRAIREGLRRGAKAVGFATASPLALADADILNLSGFAAERVLDVAELHSLRIVLLRWPEALTTAGVEPTVDRENYRNGTAWEQQKAVRERVRDLEQIVAEPYCDPTEEPIAVALPPAYPCDPCWPCPGACE
jgi:hypothetical protein